MRRSFEHLAMTERNPEYGRAISRRVPLYEREGDERSPFVRDYTRVLHSLAYRRLKHKTQVFYNVGNDHICTRMEHVSHVESVSEAIAASLGLNRELTRAIAIAHDLGHPPFGHQGERIISGISLEYIGESFWHEKHGLRIADCFELLEDNHGIFRPLDLTYAVRDGIIAHCGEVDENGIFPRDPEIGVEAFASPGDYQPYTWEGCVVKLSDKIAYLVRDIEDAIRLCILSREDRHHLCRIIGSDPINTTVLINDFVTDVCKNSSPERGICLGGRSLEMMNEIKQFNTDNIYRNSELETFGRYAKLVLTSLFESLHSCYDFYDPEKTFENLKSGSRRGIEFRRSFADRTERFCAFGSHPEYATEPVYGCLDNIKLYDRAIIDFISGMTDSYAIKAFDELITF